MQRRPPLGGVDPLAREQGVAARLDAPLAGEGAEEADGLGVDQVLGVVEEKVAELQGKSYNFV